MENLENQRHAFGVDDAPLYRVPFSARVSSFKRYWVTCPSTEAVGCQSEDRKSRRGALQLQGLARRDEQGFTATWIAALLASVEIVKYRHFLDERPKSFLSLGVILRSTKTGPEGGESGATEQGSQCRNDPSERG